MKLKEESAISANLVVEVVSSLLVQEIYFVPTTALVNGFILNVCVFPSVGSNTMIGGINSNPEQYGIT